VVPLVVKDQANRGDRGGQPGLRRPLESEPLHVLQMFASQAALVLENAQLYSTIEANNRELLLIRERMLESDRLAALSSLASGMAHEIRNPLVSIGGFARRIAKLVEVSSPLRATWRSSRRKSPAWRSSSGRSSISPGRTSPITGIMS